MNEQVEAFVKMAAKASGKAEDQGCEVPCLTSFPFDMAIVYGPFLSANLFT